MSDNKITDYTSVSKSNHKILKFITIILSILIVICLFFLIIGFINKFGELEKKEKTISKDFKSEYSLYYPKDSQIISVNYTSDNQLLLRYQMDGENKLILVDLLKEKILTKNINMIRMVNWLQKEIFVDTKLKLKNI